MHSVLAIYPTAHKVEDLLKRETQAHGCLLGHRVTTFPQVTDALWRETSVARMAVGPVGERLALEEAIARTRARGIGLAFVAGNGVRDHLHRLIRELKSAAVEAGDLRSASAELPTVAAGKVADIAEIFAEYDRLLSEVGAADAHDRERLVLAVLHESEAAGRRPRLLSGVTSLLIAEVYDFSLLQFMLVSSLIRLIGDATLAIQAEPFDLRVSRLAELTWNRFVSEQSIGDQVLPDFVRRDGRSGRLGFVLTHLFARPRATTAGQSRLSVAPGEQQEPSADEVELPPEDGTVRIIEAPNPGHEALVVAREIRRLLELPAAKRPGLHRIAIVTGNLELYADHLETAFRRYRIPLNLLRRQRLSAFAPARVVRDILRIPALDYHHESLLSLCRAPFVQFAAVRYSQLPAEVGYIDRKTRPLAMCLELRREELGRVQEQATEAAQLTARRRLERFERGARAWNELMELLASLETPATLAEYAARMLVLLDQLGFNPARDSLTDAAACAAGPLRSAFDTLADEATIFASGRQLTVDEFGQVVERVLDEVTVEPATNHLAGGVRAMAVADARGLDFDLVFIIGLNDGIFPAYHLEDPLLPDDDIRKLNPLLRQALRRRMGRFAPDAPGPILRTHDDHNAEEPFLFFLAMSMPAHGVVLCYSATDSAGRLLRPSPFVAEVRRILNATRERISGGELIPSVTDCYTPIEFLARAALDAALPRSPLAASVETQSILRRTAIERARITYLALPSREELVDERRRRNRRDGASWLSLDLSPNNEKSASAGAFDGRINPRPALNSFLLEGRDGAQREWSAAQLTELAACGFKFFARRILLLHETDATGHEQTSLEAGTLVHQILYAVFTQAESSDEVSLRLTAQQVLDDFHHRERIEARDSALFEVGWVATEAMVNEIIEYEVARRVGGMPTRQMCHEFDLNLTLARDRELGVTEPLTVRLCGQIDRLEIYRDGGRIRRLKLIDYKASHRLSDYAELLKPDHFACENLQMPVYALGAATHFRAEMTSDTAVELSYIALKDRDKETEPRQVPLAALDGPREPGAKTVAARILDLVADAQAGHFEVDPLDCSDYCPYRRVCRYRRPIFRP